MEIKLKFIIFTTINNNENLINFNFMPKTQKTLNELNNLRNNFSSQDYENYLNGDLKLKDIYKIFNCCENSFDYFLQEKGWLGRIAAIRSSTKHDFFNTIDTSEKAYILGFYIADGCLVKNKICFSLNLEDLQILKDIKNYLCPITKISYTKERINKSGILSHSMCKISITSDEMSKTLEKYGLGHRKTYLAKSIKNIIPNELMWDFIRGYFDGDGCVSASDTTKKHITKTGEEKVYHHWNIGFTIISKDRMILDEINEFFIKEGIDTHVYPDTRENFLVGTHSLEEVKKIYNKLYTTSNLYLQRKKEKFNKIMKIPR